VRREIRSVEPGYQGQYLLGRPAASVYHDEMLMDRLWQLILESLLDTSRVKVVAAA
jgi:hypothetical protein